MAGFPPTSLGYSKLSTYLLRRAAWCVALLFVSLPGGRLCGADPLVQFNLLELATSRQAQASLQSEASFFFEQRPLREGLQEIAEVHGLSLWIDRRIDPTRPLTFNASPRDERTELAARLQQVSALADAEFGLIESVIYVGPRGQAERLQRAAVVLHDAISRLQPGNQVQQRDWQWPELSTPNTILKKLEADWQISLAAELPHDLLHAGQLRQPTTLATQLTLLFGGFAQAVQATAAGRFQAAPLAAEGGWQASYRKADLDLKDWRALQHRFPGSEVRVRGTLAQLRGPTAFHL
ncbi:MAG: hypothetical protein KDA45_17295, partial [Planctomycetales bacterium]|nr:hypothetical protein [Planctomycetales bacterium]